MWKHLILLKGASYSHHLRAVLFIFEVLVKSAVKAFKINYV